MNGWLRLSRQHRWFLAVSVGLIGSFLINTLLPSSAIAQISQATVTEILGGDAVFIERLLIDEDETTPDFVRELATENAIAEFQDVIRTEDARTSLLFSNGAAGRLGPNSQITVGQCIEVQQGLLLAAGPANGCTATFAVGVQGTIYAIANQPEEEDSQVYVLEGEVEVTLNAPPESEAEETAEPTTEENPLKQAAAESSPDNEPSELDPNSRTRRVQAGQSLAISRRGFGSLRQLSEAEILELLRGSLFDGFRGELPGMGRLQTVLTDLYPNIDLPRLPGFRFRRPRFPGLPPIF